MGLGNGLFDGCLEVHPAGKREAEKSLAVDTHGRRIHVEWDPASPVTPLGQLVFVDQFVATGGLLYHWVERYPPRFSSPNAPTLTNLLGTITLSVRPGPFRYVHITRLRAYTINPIGLEMSKVRHEDSGRAFAAADAKSCADWQLEALQKTWLPALRHPGVLGLDVTVKPIYGRAQSQRGALVSKSTPCRTLFEGSIHPAHFRTAWWNSSQSSRSLRLMASGLTVPLSGIPLAASIDLRTSGVWM